MQRDALDDPQVRGRHPQGAGGAEGVRRAAARQAAQPTPRRQAAATRTSCTRTAVARWTTRSSSSARCCARTAARLARRDDGHARARSRLVGLADRASRANDALRATMVKRAVDVAAFEQLFDLFFSGLGEAIKDDRPTRRRTRSSSTDARVPEVPRGAGAAPRGAGHRALAAGAGAAAQRRRRGSSAAPRGRRSSAQLGDDPSTGSRKGGSAHALAEALGLGGARSSELEALRDRSAGLDPREPASSSARYLDRRLQDLADMIKQAARQELERQDVDRREQQRLQALAEKSFYYLTEDEIRRMQEAVTKLAQRLKNVVSIRRKRARRGRFDSSARCGKNLQYGGVPFRRSSTASGRTSRRSWCSATSRTRSATCRASCCSSSTRSRTSTRRCGASSSSPTSARSRELFKDHDVQRGDRPGAPRQRHQRLRALRLRAGVQDVPPRLPVCGEQAHDRDRARRRAQQLQPAARVGAARTSSSARSRSSGSIPENRMTWGFGDSEMDRYAPHLHRGRGVPQPEPALPRHRPPRTRLSAGSLH